MKNFFTDLHYKQKHNLKDKATIVALSPFSLAYSCISEVRNILYKHNLLKIYTPKTLTISIGNLTTGGTGKTPITAALANHLTSKGYKVAILSRGYGSKLNSKEINVISDGSTIFYDALTGGDEPVWLAQNCPSSVVLTSSNRVKIAKYAQKIGCNALILDDGFQHQKLGRDINICVVDSEKQFGNQKVLPCGPLREQIKNIKRANKIIIVCKNGQEPPQNLIAKLNKLTHKAQIQICKIKIDKIYNIQDENTIDITNKQVLAFCAIGQPEQFYNLLSKNGANLVKTISFADHHAYKIADINELAEEAKTHNAELIITTEKDAVKIKRLTQKAIYALKLGIDWDAENILNN